MLRGYLVLIFLAFLTYSSAQSPNWAEHVAPILYNHCVTCHRPGEIAPFSLIEYQDAIDHAIEMEQQVNAHLMPPWPADPNYRHYTDENLLLQSEIDVINDWLNIGAPEGNPNLAPDPPQFPEGSQIGIPDTVISMSQAYIHPGDGLDHYMIFAVPSGFMTQKNIAAIEFRAGNKTIVHHTFIFYDTTGTVAYSDSITPGYGLEGQNGSGLNQCKFVTLFRPGMIVRKFPSNLGFKIPAGADIIFQIHYAPADSNITDSSMLNVFFADNDSVREVTSVTVKESDLIEPFLIPANAVTTFHSEKSFDSDLSLIGISLHMHLLGQSYKVFAVTPLGDTIPLVYVPDWNFNWQMMYYFQYLQKIDSGTTIFGEITYDNTVNNADNPNNPPIDIGFGIGTSDEMCRYFLLTVPYEEGDESILLDSSLIITHAPEINGIATTPQLYSVYPNPAGNNFTVQFYLPSEEKVSLYLVDLSGKLVQTILNDNLASGFHEMDVDTRDFTAGVYFVRMVTGQFRLSKKAILLTD